MLAKVLRGMVPEHELPPNLALDSSIQDDLKLLCKDSLHADPPIQFPHEPEPGNGEFLEYGTYLVVELADGAERVRLKNPFIKGKPKEVKFPIPEPKVSQEPRGTVHTHPPISPQCPNTRHFWDGLPYPGFSHTDFECTILDESNLDMVCNGREVCAVVHILGKTLGPKDVNKIVADNKNKNEAHEICSDWIKLFCYLRDYAWALTLQQVDPTQKLPEPVHSFGTALNRLLKHMENPREPVTKPEGSQNPLSVIDAMMMAFNEEMCELLGLAFYHAEWGQEPKKVFPVA